MSEHGIGEDRRRSEYTVGTRTDGRGQDRVSTLEKQNEQLLPGIPDEITLDCICTKLPWRDFHTLSSVSRLWQHVIQRHQVYEARVRSGSTETVVVFRHKDSAGKQEYALYSTRENSCYELPPIPFLERGSAWTCGCISLDGKIYVMGGGADGPDWLTGAAEVYVLDVAGQRQWKQCASMLEGRARFGCGIIDGKIYVFGGMTGSEPVCGSEVYDPKVDAWFPIKSMDISRYDSHVATLGKELFLYDGEHFGPYEPNLGIYHPVYYWDVYNPVTDEWRVIECDTHQRRPKFTFKGKLHSIRECGIHVYDDDRNSWADVVSLPTQDSDLIIHVTVPVEEEVVSLWFLRPGVSYILQSSGFGGEDTKVSWETVNCSLNVESDFMCPIQL